MSGSYYSRNKKLDEFGSRRSPVIPRVPEFVAVVDIVSIACMRPPRLIGDTLNKHQHFHFFVIVFSS